MPTLRLNEDAQQILTQYNWNGNIRQLRNVAEQISVLEKERELNTQILRSYLPDMGSQLPAISPKEKESGDFASEREILYKVLFDMKNDLNDLKKLTLELMKQETSEDVQEKNQSLIKKIYGESPDDSNLQPLNALPVESQYQENKMDAEESYDYAETIVEEEPLSLLQKEIEMIKTALERSKGKRKLAAEELGISERTLYRKIKQYDLNDGSED
jgi:DNA-binding NtrC family response regulator